MALDSPQEVEAALAASYAFDAAAALVLGPPHVIPLGEPLRLTVRVLEPEALDETAVELLIALWDELELLREWQAFRREAGLLPTGADCLRLRRWNRQAARHGMFLPWECLP